MNTIYKVKRKTDRIALIDKLVSMIKEGKSEQFVLFVDIIFLNGFFDSLSNEDLDYAVSNNEFSWIPLMTSKNITIGFDIYDNSHIRIGLDPCNRFNKTSQCRVLESFPMKKRAYNSFVKLFNNLMDEKSNIRLSFFE